MPPPEVIDAPVAPPPTPPVEPEVAVEPAPEPTIEPAPPPAPEPAPSTPPAAFTSSRSIDLSKQQDLTAALEGFCSSVEDVHGAVLASRDGLTIASSSLADSAAIRLAAMAATVQAVAEREIQGEHTMIRAGDGCVVVYPAGPDGVLALQTSARPNVGLVGVLAPDAAGELARILAA